MAVVALSGTAVGGNQPTPCGVANIRDENVPYPLLELFGDINPSHYLTNMHFLSINITHMYYFIQRLFYLLFLNFLKCTAFN